MQFLDTAKELHNIVARNVPSDTLSWLEEKQQVIVSEPSGRELYTVYSLLSGKVAVAQPVEYPSEATQLTTYLEKQNADILQLARIGLLVSLLQTNPSIFGPKVANLIQVADTGELVTFLKFLILLPEPERYKIAAVEALRTNIATVFDAIALENPYPAEYFNEHQWNQMYLKAAFMQRDLSRIEQVDERANEDLARIISDYAHERWSASREVDPLFWRPVTKFIGDALLKDMEHLLKSNSKAENYAAALCCFQSGNTEAAALLAKYPELAEHVANQSINWTNLKE